MSLNNSRNEEEDSEDDQLKYRLFGVFNFLKKLIRRLTRSLPGTLDLEEARVRLIYREHWPSLRQLRHSYRIFTNTERRVLVSALIVFVASSMWLGVNQVGARLISEPAKGGTYTEGLVGQPQFLNPIFSGASAIDSDLTRLLFSGLFRYTQSLDLEPDLAESYTVSEDGKVYTVTLKENLTWHDDEPLTIDDVIFTFESITDPDLISPLGQSLKGVVIERVDDKTIRFTLGEPYAPFLNTLTLGIIPRHIWGEIPTKQWRLADFNIRPIGSGPWAFSTLKKDKDGFIKSYSFDRVMKTDEISGFIERLIFRFYPDEISAKKALTGRNIQGLALLSGDEASNELFGGGLEHYDLKLPATTAIFFNLEKQTALQDINVRQALRDAIDKRKLIIEVLPGQATPSFGALPTRTLFKQKEHGPSTGNPKAAEATLTKSGWERVGAIRQNDKDQTLEITLTIIDREPDRSVGAYVQKAWRAIGVETKIELVAPATPTNIQRTVLRPRSFEALLYTIVYGAMPDPYPFWHSSQRVDPGLNLSGFSNKEADEIIEKGRRSIDEKTREEAYLELHDIINKDVPVIFLFSPIRQYVVSNDIKGIMVNNIATPADRFNNLDEWYTETNTKLNW